MRQLGKWLRETNPDYQIHGSVDTSPVLERAIAERCGVGWIGKSTMLIHPEYGTFGSIAVLLSNAIFSEISHPIPHRCGTCTACYQVCPTGALSDQGLDARLCISYWTIEHRGLIPTAMRRSIGEWVFGCDLCQEVCPWTMKAGKRSRAAQANLWLPQSDRARPDLRRWLRMSDQELDIELQGSPLRRAFPRGLKRNALIVLANTGMLAALPDILNVLDHDDEAVRGTAAWAIAELLDTDTHSSLQYRDLDRSIDKLTARLEVEAHSEVKRELEEALQRLSVK